MENKKIKQITIADNERFLRQLSMPVDIERDKKLLEDIKVLEDFCKENEVMAMAAIQLGIPKRYFVIVHEQEEKETFKNYVLINPRIISTSEEMIYVEEGEGCLSVNREVEGIVPRCARVTIEGYDMDGNKVKYRGREELAVAFQHELDHLNGIMFTDRIDKDDPYKNADIYRAI